MKVLAYFLPQFHQDYKNNQWWGEGFTEWTHLKNSKKYYKWQKIRKPISNYYDLSSVTELENQFLDAKSCGIDGFVVWNYWFGDGVKVLDKPLEIILESNIEFKFCLAWANHSWFNKTKGVLLQEQRYLGSDDYLNYFNYCARFFKSKNYILIKNKPVFFIFQPKEIPDIDCLFNIFNENSKLLGFDGIFFVAENSVELPSGFDKYVSSGELLRYAKYVSPLLKIKEILKKKLKFLRMGPAVFDYGKLVDKKIKRKRKENEIPVALTGWDTTPRHRKNGVILKNFSPINFEKEVKWAFDKDKGKDEEIILLKSWNEWAEGNLLEIDSVYGESIRSVIKKYSIN